jgi:hypothetical protein
MNAQKNINKNQSVIQKPGIKVLVLAVFWIKNTPITRVFIPITRRKFSSKLVNASLSG